MNVTRESSRLAIGAANRDDSNVRIQVRIVRYFDALCGVEVDRVVDLNSDFLAEFLEVED